MPDLAHDLGRRRGVVAAIASIILGAALVSCGEKAAVHTGTLPADQPPLAPHVIEAPAFEAPVVAGPPPRELAFGITEDELPLGLRIEDLKLGADASGALLAAVAVALAFAWLLRAAAGGRAQPAAAGAAASGQAGAATLGGAGPAVVSTNALVIPAQQALTSLSMVSASALEGALPAVALPRGPSLAERSGRAVRVSALATGHALRWTARRSASGTRRVARWTSMAARASWRLVAYAPRQAYGDFQRRRSPFREGGDFWIRGTEMLRMGVQNEAERHYWSGFYECQNRGWDIEGAECLRRLAHMAAQRGDIDEALRHFEGAATAFEQRHDAAHLERVRSEIRQLTGASTAGGAGPAHA